MRPRIAIVGGGVTGLAAAHAVVESSPAVDVLLLESRDRLGGVVETVRRNGFLMEAAADGFLRTPEFAIDLCRRLGIDDALVDNVASRRQAFVLRDEKLLALPAGFTVMVPSRIRPLLTSRLLSVRGKCRAALEYLIPGKHDDNDESLADFVCRRFGREMYERIVQPLISGIYAGDPERLSAGATMPRFRQMEREHGSLIRAALHGRSAGNAQAKASGARYSQFVSLRSGMSSLVDALTARLRACAVQLRSPVERISPSESGRWDLTIGGNRPRRAEVDGVVLAAPAYRVASMLADLDRDLKVDLAATEYSSCAVVSLGFQRDQIKHPLNGFGFVVPLVEQRSILSCSFSSLKYEGRAPEGSVLLRVFVGGACQSGLLSLPHDQIVELAEREVKSILSISGEPTIRHLQLQTRSMPQYAVGHTSRVASMNRRLSRFPSLALAGSAYGGVGIPGCIRSGEDAARRVMSFMQTRSTRSHGCPC